MPMAREEVEVGLKADSKFNSWESELADLWNLFSGRQVQ